MSGYLSGTLAILCINLIFAYGIFVPAAAGQINLGGAGFQAIGAYAAGWLAGQIGAPIWLSIVAAALTTALVGFLISFPVLRTRGVYMVLATFAFGEVVVGLSASLARFRRRYGHGRAAAHRTLGFGRIRDRRDSRNIVFDGDAARPGDALGQ